MKNQDTTTQRNATAPALEGYDTLLNDLKERIQSAQVKAALSVNRELLLLYWHIGQQILREQEQRGWGSKVIQRLSRDLLHTFPDMKGFSTRNLVYMQTFAAAYPDFEFTQALPAQITWYHNCTLLDKVHDPQERAWYIRQTIENGWSRNVLVLHIDSGLYARQGKAVTNFKRTLPEPASDLAHNLLKDPYNFDFLGLGEKALEREIERGLTHHIREFLLELGQGFAFVGNQYHIEVGSQDFYLDLLFYHLGLRRYVVIDLKAKEFTPEDAGKMNFYLSAVDDVLRHGDDQPSIGIILVKTKNKVMVEYALRDMNKPISVSEFHTEKMLPPELQSSLPTIEELEATLNDGTDDAGSDA